MQLFLTPISQVSIDIFIIGSTIACFFAIGIWIGKTQLTSLLLAFSLAAFGYSLFGNDTLFTMFGAAPERMAAARLVFFLILAIVLSILISRVAYAYSAHSVTARGFDIGLLSVGVTALLLAFYYHPLALMPLYTFGPSIEMLFGSAAYTFWWFVGSLAAFFLAVRR